MLMGILVHLCIQRKDVQHPCVLNLIVSATSVVYEYRKISILIVYTKQCTDINFIPSSCVLDIDSSQVEGPNTFVVAVSLPKLLL